MVNYFKTKTIKSKVIRATPAESYMLQLFRFISLPPAGVIATLIDNMEQAQAEKTTKGAAILNLLKDSLNEITSL